jgi:2-iminobutanoate/2-iminopropanoate deaminase
MSAKQAIWSPGAPGAIGPYSPALRAGQLLFVSGQVALHPQTGDLVAGGIGAETRQVLENIGALLRAGGLDFSAVVRATVYLTDLEDFKAMNAVYGGYFREPFPTRATVQVARLPKDARVEIDVIASYDGAS